MKSLHYPVTTHQTHVRDTHKANSSQPFLSKLLLLYAFTVPLPNNVFVPEEIRIAIYNYRPYTVLVFVALVLMFGAMAKGRRLIHVLRDRVLGTLTFLALLFPAYYAFSAVAKNRISIPVMGLYGVWAIYCFVAMPILIRNKSELNRLLLGFAFISVINMLLVSVLAYFGDIQTAYPPGWAEEGVFQLFTRIAPLGYLNANFYAQIPQVLYAIVLFFLVVKATDASVWQKRLNWIAMSVLMLIILHVSSRNVLVAVFVMSITLWQLNRGPTNGWLLLAGFFTATFFASIAATESNFEELNALSTGRLKYWDFLLEHILQSDTPIQSLLFGPEVIPHYAHIDSYDPLVAKKAFTKLHVDNFYLEILLEAGSVGFVLFMAPYFAIVWRLYKNLANIELRAISAWGISLMAGLAAQGMFAGTIPTFNSPMGLFFATILIGTLRHATKRT